MSTARAVTHGAPGAPVARPGWPALALAAILFLAAAAEALAQPGSERWISELEDAPPIAADAADADYVRFGLDAAPWIAEAVAARAAARGDAPTARQIALLRGAGERSYLAITWVGEAGPSVEVLAVPPLSEQPDDIPLLRPLREIMDSYVALVEPSGTRPFPGEPPVLAVSHAAGVTRASTRIILLTGDTIDITPDWAGRTIGLRDLDGDGAAEIVALDESWHGFPLYCTPCGPRVVVVLRRAYGASHLACAEFPDVYRSLADQPTYAEDWFGLLARRSEIALNAAQAGTLNQARAAAASLVDVARMQDSSYIDGSGNLFDQALRIAADVERAAAEGPESACPLSAISRPYAWTPWWIDPP